MNDLRGMEFKVNQALGFPMEKARLASEAAAGPREDPVDNFRHSNAGRYTTEAIANYTGNIPYVSSALGFLGANALGLGHEAMTLLKGNDKRDLSDRLLESGEDMYNNFIGAKVGASDMTPEEKTNYLRYLSSTNQLADGVVIPKNSKSKSVDNMYFKKGPNDPGKYKSSYDDGGEYEEAELTDEEIEEYRKGGWVVEEIEEYDNGGGVNFQSYEQQLRQLENSVKAGYKGGKWYPHDSVEGGNKTIGYGHKLSGKENYSQGLTTAQVLALQKKDLARHTNIAKYTVDKKYGAGTFDKLPESRKVLLVDYAYNGVLHKFPNFMAATVKGDKAGMLKEYKRYTNGAPLSQRNAWTRSVIEGTSPATKQVNTPKTLPAKPTAKKQAVKKPITQPVAKPKFSVNETFSYDQRPGAVYKVADSGDWFINLGNDTHNEFVKLNDPTGKRTELLKKYAHMNEVPLDQILNRINNSGNYDSRIDLGYVPGQ
jgi:GH24 family phage-related lysozyme (muramidase)